MNTKLQELTDKIYTEGVEKGKTEAAEIVAKAETEAREICENAKAEAEQIIKHAQSKAEEIQKNTQSELRLFTEQSINVLKTEITNLISDKVVTDSVKAATADPKFMQSIIVDIARSWIKDGNVNIDAKDAKSLEDYFMSNAKSLLDQGVKINEVKGIKTDFTISPSNEGYKLTFGNEEFIKYFKEFLRPKLIEMLF